MRKWVWQSIMGIIILWPGTCVLKLPPLSLSLCLTRMQVACVCLLGAHCDAQKYARVNAFKLHFDNIIGKSQHNTHTQPSMCATGWRLHPLGLPQIIIWRTTYVVRDRVTLCRARRTRQDHVSVVWAGQNNFISCPANYPVPLLLLCRSCMQILHGWWGQEGSWSNRGNWLCTGWWV